jgi:cyclic pyranopterin phosphate synthase
MPDESTNSDFTHVRDGLPTMVNVAGKQPNQRSAVAAVRVELGSAIIARFANNDLQGPKGPVLQTAIIAGTMAAKKTSDLIPFCHPLPIEHCAFEITPDATGLTIRCEVTTTGKTGVEMEAMTGASVAALTVYDMCKALNKGIRIQNLHLVAKTGGKSGDYRVESEIPQAGSPLSMTDPKPVLHGLVLAGGRSARMGSDKAALVHPDGRPLARRTYDLLAEAGCATVVLSLRHDQALPPGFSDLENVAIARDPEGASQGPLAGMIAAMRQAPTADWLVLACDLPRLDLGTLTHLVASKRRDEALLAYSSEFDDLPEPLCALYAAGSLAILEQAQAAGIHCPRKILIRRQCRLLEPATPRALDNANTPADWQTATNP